MKSWTVEDLKKKLGQNNKLKAWAIYKDNFRRLERYFLNHDKKLAVDQDRDVTGEEFSILLHVAKDNNRQGEIFKQVDPFRPLQAQLDEAILQAEETDFLAWSFASPPTGKIEKLDAADPRIIEDIDQVMKELSARIEKTVANEKRALFNSAELFVTLSKRQTELSNGFSFESVGSRIYAEAAYSSAKIASSGAEHSDEFLNTTMSVGVHDLNIEKLFASAAENSRHMLSTQKPDTGLYPVILHADSLAQVFEAYLGRLSSSSLFYKYPHIATGDPFIPEAFGDKITLSSNPEIPFGALTRALSSDGVLQKKLNLVSENQVLAQLTDKRFSDYLNIPLTTGLANIEIAAGSLAFEEMLKLHPKTLEIVQFSGLFIDAISATFSSEIRLARLYDRESGKVTFIKGGSLSGTMLENFTRLRLSKDRVKHAHVGYGGHAIGYYGPECMLLNDVSIVG